MSIVYAVQRPAFRTENGWVGKYDMSPAELLGELRFLLPEGNIDADLRPTTLAIYERLDDFNKDRDYFLPVGDPIACAIAAACLARCVPYFTTLKFDRRANVYLPYRVEP
jgi:hypothetical protein